MSVVEENEQLRLRVVELEGQVFQLQSTCNKLLQIIQNSPLLQPLTSSINNPFTLTTTSNQLLEPTTPQRGSRISTDSNSYDDTPRSAQKLSLQVETMSPQDLPRLPRSSSSPPLPTSLPPNSFTNLPPIPQVPQRPQQRLSSEVLSPIDTTRSSSETSSPMTNFSNSEILSPISTSLTNSSSSIQPATPTPTSDIQSPTPKESPISSPIKHGPSNSLFKFAQQTVQESPSQNARKLSSQQQGRESPLPNSRKLSEEIDSGADDDDDVELFNDSSTRLIPILQNDGTYQMYDGVPLKLPPGSDGVLGFGVVRTAVCFFGPNDLQVLVDRTRGIPKSKTGLTDLSIKLGLILDGVPAKKIKRKRTAKVSHHSNIVFNETFSFDLSSTKEVRRRTLEISLWFYKGLKKEFIAHALVELCSVPVQRLIGRRRPSIPARAWSWYALYIPYKMTPGSNSIRDKDIVKYPDGSLQLANGHFKLPNGVTLDRSVDLVPANLPPGAVALPDGTIQLHNGCVKLPSGALLRGDGRLRYIDNSIHEPLWKCCCRRFPPGVSQNSDFTFYIEENPRGKSLFSWSETTPPKSLIKESLLNDTALNFGILKFGASYHKTSSRLSLTVLEARSLPGVDVSGLSDPYLVIHLLGLEPNELRATLEVGLKLVFPRSTYAEWTSRELIMEYYFEKVGVTKTHTKSASDTPRKKVNGNGPKRDGPITSLSLLTAGSAFGDVVYYLEGQTHRATLNPKFNETFIFSDLVEGDVNRYKVDIQIWDWNRIAEHKFLCHITLPLSELLLENPNITTPKLVEGFSDQELIDLNEIKSSWYALQCPTWGSEKEHWKARKPFKKTARRESIKNKWQEERNERRKNEIERLITEKEGTIASLEKEQQRLQRYRSASRRTSVPTLGHRPLAPSISYTSNTLSPPSHSHTLPRPKDSGLTIIS